MVAKRIIAALDIKGDRVVKGVNFQNMRDAGDPVECAVAYERRGIDELVFLDINATHENRALLLDLATRIARHISIPFTVGGGVRSVDDFAQLLKAGADKVFINSAALFDPELITMAAQRFGSQCVVVAIDAKRGERGWQVYTHGGRKPFGLDAVDWARQAAERGCGEILLTGMDTDGTMAGFALELTRAVSDSVSVPVIASGGAGTVQHFVDVLTDGHADAALAASLFHDGHMDIDALKQELTAHGLYVRRDLA